MKSQDAKFKSHLRREVETAGRRYEEAVEKVFALIGAPGMQPGSELLDAIQAAGQTLRLYTGALHDLAVSAAKEAQTHELEIVESREPVFAHI